jgi:type I restriction enzyme S subunit
LGELPQHWKTKPMRRLGHAIIGLTYSPHNVVQEGEGTLVLRASNLQNGQITRNDNVFVNAAIPDELKTRTGDILICSRSGSRDLVGKCAKISSADAGLTFGAFTTVFRSEQNDFIFYVLNSSLFSFQAGLYQTSTIYQLTTGTLNSLVVPTPPEDEQRAIADFLDRNTARLDTLVGKKRELIEKLKEKRTALISRTVTRGLNPNVKFKPSGIEWLGDIPEHWEQKQLKWAVMFQRGHDLPSDQREEGNIPLVTSAGISSTHSRAVAKAPGIVTGRYGTIGEFHLVLEDYWPLNTTLYTVSMRQNEPRFLRYMLQHLSPLFLLNAVKSAVPGVDRNDIHPTNTALPPVPEQRAIADYLDRETAKLDRMMEKVEAAIEKLQEYRTGFITAAVTGKIDVRNGPKSAVST